MPDPLRNFEGVANVNGVAPPDTQGDVGPNHYVQWVNLSFAVYDKSGNKLFGPAAGSTARMKTAIRDMPIPLVAVNATPTE